MKQLITSTIFTLLFSITITAQQLNTEIVTGETSHLLGKIDKSDLESDNYASWFTKNYESYHPNQSLIKEIASELKTYSIKLFMGTWCGDSKQEVPKLYKVLDACDFPMEQLTAVAVSRQPDMYKQSPQHEEVGLNIHRVPTIIFYKANKEVNRIVEHPIVSFEEDILNIITKNDYKSNYQIVTVIDEILKKKGVKGLKRQSKKLLISYIGKVTSMFELNTYGIILYGTNRIDEAIEVFTLNTKLFPNEVTTYISLANTFAIIGNPQKGIEILKKATELFPENEYLKKNIENLKSM
jgi:tetratricopeptide (TPR) repeat protein